MPLFEHNYEGVWQSQDGKTKKRIPPQLVLRQAGSLLEGVRVVRHARPCLGRTQR